MITDVHRHFVPEKFFQFVCDRPEYDVKIEGRHRDGMDLNIRGVNFRLNGAFFDLDEQYDRMTKDGIDRSILSLATPFINDSLEPEAAVRMAREYNDILAASIEASTDRFGAWAFLPLQDPKAAAEELRRCVVDLGFIGGHIGSNVQGIYLNDGRFSDLFGSALNLNVPLFVHPADPLGKERMREYELMIVAGYLFDNTINILKLICSGFIDKWPRLKLLFAHGGAFSLVLRARMQREVDTNPELSAVLKRSIGEYLSTFYYDTICFEPEILRYAAGVVPVERFMLGSDAPFPLGEPNPVEFVKGALDSRQSEAILHQNFSRMVGR